MDSNSSHKTKNKIKKQILTKEEEGVKNTSIYGEHKLSQLLINGFPPESWKNYHA